MFEIGHCITEKHQQFVYFDQNHSLLDYRLLRKYMVKSSTNLIAVSGKSSNTNMIVAAASRL